MSPRKISNPTKRKSKQMISKAEPIFDISSSSSSSLSSSIHEHSLLAPIKDQVQFIAMNSDMTSPILLSSHEYSQYPSNEQFNAIVNAYLMNLSLKKRDKALVDHERYALILKVLKDPRNTSISTAQFRFWVKKMFRLGSRKNAKQGMDEEIVCHDNKPVAVREDIYYILILAHKEAQHGGRDKTSAIVRRRYSWIPKELIARFVRHCPFCISRRNNMCMHPHEHTSDCLTSTKNDDIESIASDLYPPSNPIEPYFLSPKAVRRKRRRQRLSSFSSSPPPPPPWKKHNHPSFDSNYISLENDPVTGFSMAATVATSAAVVAVAAAAAAAAAATTTTSSSTTPNHFIPSPESLTDLDYMMVEEQCPNVSLPTSMFDFYYDHHHLISPTSTELIHHPLDLNSFDLLQSCFPSDMIHLNNMNPIFSAKDEEELIYLLNHNDNIHAQHHSSQNNINNQPLTKAPSCCASVTSSDISESTTIDSTYLLEQLLRQQENYMNICPVPSSPPPPPLPPPSKSSDGPFDQQLLMLSSNTTDGNFITSITASPSSSK